MFITCPKKKKKRSIGNYKVLKGKNKAIAHSVSVVIEDDD